MSLLRSGLYERLQIGRQQAAQSRDVGAAPCRLILQLVLADLADVEVRAVGMGQVEAADAGRRLHGQALGQFHADFLRLQKLEQSYPTYHLLLGIAYADAGLTVLAEQELERLQKANPKSAFAARLLLSVRSWSEVK